MNAIIRPSPTRATGTATAALSPEEHDNPVQEVDCCCGDELGVLSGLPIEELVVVTNVVCEEADAVALVDAIVEE